MHVVINGNDRDFPALDGGSTVANLIDALNLKADRIALEHNGIIVRRDAWSLTVVNSGDKFEIVHFVGGGRS